MVLILRLTLHLLAATVLNFELCILYSWAFLQVVGRISVPTFTLAKNTQQFLSFKFDFLRRTSAVE
jgi:hypothetical protein